MGNDFRGVLVGSPTAAGTIGQRLNEPRSTAAGELAVGAFADGAFGEVFSARPVLDQIANKWSVLVLTVLCQQPSRFNAIKRRLEGISHKALTEALRRLERSGLVDRTVHDTSPVAVEYTITPLGRSLQGPFEALYAWAADNAGAVAAAQSSYDLQAAEGRTGRAA